jgi:hypothetical protein
MKHLPIAMAVLLLAGCASLEGKTDNRVACTVAKDKLLLVAEFGRIGFSLAGTEADRAVICK